ncbi:MAG: hypothetical protein HQK96_20755 [Nitrospirae bacterium]|nr:hypothetical protein [Nitrospirota bacterium]
MRLSKSASSVRPQGLLGNSATKEGVAEDTAAVGEETEAMGRLSPTNNVFRGPPVFFCIDN